MFSRLLYAAEPWTIRATAADSRKLVAFEVRWYCLVWHRYHLADDINLVVAISSLHQTGHVSTHVHNQLSQRELRFCQCARVQQSAVLLTRQGISYGQFKRQLRTLFCLEVN